MPVQADHLQRPSVRAGNLVVLSQLHQFHRIVGNIWSHLCGLSTFFSDILHLSDVVSGLSAQKNQANVDSSGTVTPPRFHCSSSGCCHNSTGLPGSTLLQGVKSSFVIPGLQNSSAASFHLLAIPLDIRNKPPIDSATPSTPRPALISPTPFLDIHVRTSTS